MGLADEDRPHAQWLEMVAERRFPDPKWAAVPGRTVRSINSLVGPSIFSLFKPTADVTETSEIRVNHGARRAFDGADEGAR